MQLDAHPVVVALATAATATTAGAAATAAAAGTSTAAATAAAATAARDQCTRARVAAGQAPAARAAGVAGHARARMAGAASATGLSVAPAVGSTAAAVPAEIGIPWPRPGRVTACAACAAEPRTARRVDTWSAEPARAAEGAALARSPVHAVPAAVPGLTPLDRPGVVAATSDASGTSGATEAAVPAGATIATRAGTAAAAAARARRRPDEHRRNRRLRDRKRALVVEYRIAEEAVARAIDVGKQFHRPAAMDQIDVEVACQRVADVDGHVHVLDRAEIAEGDRRVQNSGRTDQRPVGNGAAAATLREHLAGAQRDGQSPVVQPSGVEVGIVLDLQGPRSGGVLVVEGRKRALGPKPAAGRGIDDDRVTDEDVVRRPQRQPVVADDIDRRVRRNHQVTVEAELADAVEQRRSEDRIRLTRGVERRAGVPPVDRRVRRVDRDDAATVGHQNRLGDRRQRLAARDTLRAEANVIHQHGAVGNPVEARQAAEAGRVERYGTVRGAGSRVEADDDGFGDLLVVLVVANEADRPHAGGQRRQVDAVDAELPATEFGAQAAAADQQRRARAAGRLARQHACPCADDEAVFAVARRTGGQGVEIDHVPQSAHVDGDAVAHEQQGFGHHLDAVAVDGRLDRVAARRHRQEVGRTATGTQQQLAGRIGVGDRRAIAEQPAVDELPVDGVVMAVVVDLEGLDAGQIQMVDQGGMNRRFGCAGDLEDHLILPAVAEYLRRRSDTANRHLVITTTHVGRHGDGVERGIDEQPVAAAVEAQPGGVEADEGGVDHRAEAAELPAAAAAAEHGPLDGRRGAADVKADGVETFAGADRQRRSGQDRDLVVTGTEMDGRAGCGVTHEHPVSAAARRRVSVQRRRDRGVDQRQLVGAVAQRQVERFEATEIDPACSAHAKAADPTDIDDTGLCRGHMGGVVDRQRVVATVALQLQRRRDVGQVAPHGGVGRPRVADRHEVGAAAQVDLRRCPQRADTQRIGALAERELDAVGADRLQQHRSISARRARAQRVVGEPPVGGGGVAAVFEDDDFCSRRHQARSPGGAERRPVEAGDDEIIAGPGVDQGTRRQRGRLDAVAAAAGPQPDGVDSSVVADRSATAKPGDRPCGDGHDRIGDLGAGVDEQPLVAAVAAENLDARGDAGQRAILADGHGVMVTGELDRRRARQALQRDRVGPRAGDDRHRPGDRAADAERIAAEIGAELEPERLDISEAQAIVDGSAARRGARDQQVAREELQGAHAVDQLAVTRDAQAVVAAATVEQGVVVDRGEGVVAGSAREGDADQLGDVDAGAAGGERQRVVAAETLDEQRVACRPAVDDEEAAVAAGRLVAQLHDRPGNLDAGAAGRVGAEVGAIEAGVHTFDAQRVVTGRAGEDDAVAVEAGDRLVGRLQVDRQQRQAGAVDVADGHEVGAAAGVDRQTLDVAESQRLDWCAAVANLQARCPVAAVVDLVDRQHVAARRAADGDRVAGCRLGRFREDVVALTGAPVVGVAAVAAAEVVIAAAARKPVVAGATAQRVAAGTATQAVVAVATVEQVVA
ncbi:MAG: hypothetical protein AW07_04051 [Candidatus Accumulibacter sp. SK-11]|nr:MAG: hypothetical protein AW07_04051 [Candidatus Accumulibacter sp. SK-11]